MSQADLFQRVVDTVELRDGAMVLTLNLSPLLNSAPSGPEDCHLMTQVIPMELKRRGVELRLVLEARSDRPSCVDPVLVRTVARAHTWFDDLLSGRYASLREIAQKNGVSKSYVGDVLKLAFLAPDIVEAIVAGHQPAHLVSDHLTKVPDLPLDWQAQRAHFGFN